MSIPKKKYKSLTKIQSIEFLEILLITDIKHACDSLGLNNEEGKYYKRKFDAYNKDSIKGSINKLERQLVGKAEVYSSQDYKKQENCSHKDFTIFFKCKCSKILSENDLDEIIAICQKQKETIGKVRVFSLISNVSVQ